MPKIIIDIPTSIHAVLLSEANRVHVDYSDNHKLFEMVKEDSIH